MPIQMEEENDGRFVSVRAMGKLVDDDYARLVPELDRLIKKHRNLCLLFDLTDFEGWELRALWDEFKFDVKHFANFERIAIVGDKMWEQGMATFFRPFTKATIRYFCIEDAEEAWEWWREPALPRVVPTA